MANPIPSPLQRLFARVSRRLFLQSLVDMLVVSWAAALLLAALWCVAEPHLLSAAATWVRWMVAGGLVGIATAFAVLIALVNRPKDLAAALLLDERFGLQERVTTAVALTSGERESPAGQALLADVEKRIGSLDVPSRFPLALRWTAGLVPVCGAILAVVALLYRPNPTHATVPENSLDQPLANAATVEKAMKKLEKKPKEQKKGEPVKSEALEQFEEEMDRLTVRPRQTRKQAQDLVKDATALEEKMLKHQRSLTERRQALQEQLQQMDRFDKSEPREGPAKEVEKALKDGQLEKAREEIEKLAKKLEDKKLTDQEQAQLEKQLKNIQDKLQKLSKLDQEEKKLEELSRREGKDGEDARRQLEQLRQNKEKLQESAKDLQDLADELGACQQCMKQGNGGQAAERLRSARQKLEKIAGQEEMEQLEEQLDRLHGAKDSLCKGCQGKGSQDGDLDQDRNNTGQASGRRPEAKEAVTGRIDARSRAEMTKGELRIEGFEKGFNLKRPKKSSEIAGEIKQASQEAPEAIDRLRIPKSVGDISRGYFENLRRESEKASEDAKPKP
jgi:hypothetical protein